MIVVQPATLTEKEWTVLTALKAGIHARRNTRITVDARRRSGCCR